MSCRRLLSFCKPASENEPDLSHQNNSRSDCLHNIRNTVPIPGHIPLYFCRSLHLLQLYSNIPSFFRHLYYSRNPVKNPTVRQILHRKFFQHHLPAALQHLHIPAFPLSALPDLPEERITADSTEGSRSGALHLLYPLLLLLPPSGHRYLYIS